MTPHEHQIIQKARVLDCYSNAPELIKKSEETKSVENTDVIVGKTTEGQEGGRKDTDVVV